MHIFHYQKKMSKRKIGNEVCADFYGCEKEKLNDIDFVRNVLQNAVRKSELKTLDMKLYRFHPQGITGYAVLMTSHISIHTYPEFNYASVDIFACDDLWKLKKAYKVFKDEFKPKKVKKIIFKRGKDIL
jgi:S-adenosylmethionine decarboxylase